MISYLCHFLCPSPSPWTSLVTFLWPSPCPCPSLWNVPVLCAPSLGPSLWSSPAPSPWTCLYPWTGPSLWNGPSPFPDPWICPSLCPCRVPPSDEGSNPWSRTESQLLLLGAQPEPFQFREAVWTSLALSAEAPSLAHPSLAEGRSLGSNYNQRTAAGVVVESSRIGRGRSIQRMHLEGSAGRFGCSRLVHSRGKQHLQVVQPGKKRKYVTMAVERMFSNISIIHIIYYLRKKNKVFAKLQKNACSVLKISTNFKNYLSSKPSLNYLIFNWIIMLFASLCIFLMRIKIALVLEVLFCYRSLAEPTANYFQRLATEVFLVPCRCCSWTIRRPAGSPRGSSWASRPL